MYYIKIKNFEKDLEEGISDYEYLYVLVMYNDLVKNTQTKEISNNVVEWNEVFLFDEEPVRVEIILMGKDNELDDNINKQGELPINKNNDIIEIELNNIKIDHGFIVIDSILNKSKKEKENEVDKDEIYYLRSVIDDNEKIIEEKEKLLKDLGERLESKTKKVKALEEDLDDVRNEASNLLEEKNERDNLVVIMGEKFNKIKQIIEA
jgi:hypothetical protein